MLKYFCYNLFMNEKELINKLKLLAGCTVKKLLSIVNIPLISILKNDKGIIGKLIERYLGLVNNNHRCQDFYNIGIELKTISINSFGFPIEDTCICSAKLIGNFDISWELSYVKNKIFRILWVPIEGNKKISFFNKRIGLPVIWNPNHSENMLLKRDWEEIMNFIILGKVEYLDSIYGQVLYIKSKSKNSNSLTCAIGCNGENIMVNPKSFYLRKYFTKMVLFNNFNLNF